MLYICSICSKRRLDKTFFVPQDVQKMFYQAYFLPLLDYGSNTSSTNIERLSKLQKRAACIILKADFMTTYSYMFEQSSWLSIRKRFMYNKAVFAYKALNNLTPAYISNLLRLIRKRIPGPYDQLKWPIVKTKVTVCPI